MTLDLRKVDEVIAEAARRARLRAEGKPFHETGGYASRDLGPKRPAETLVHRDALRAFGEAVAREPAGHVVIGSPPVAWRRGDVLWLSIPATARPKKNNTTLGIKKSPGYIRFRNAVLAAVQPFAAELRLPLPAIDYNCAAHFHRERDDADTDNLISGLADALQDAGVIADDFHLRTWNGTDRFLDVARPRVELTLTPYLPGHR